MSGGSNRQTGAREWIYAARVKGRFQKLHRLSGAVLQAILVITPWVPIGGHPAVQLDLVARRLYLFGGVYTPRDTIFLVLLLLGAAFSLFFITSLYGRLWCGFACPQTVFLEELIRPIETWWEGPRGRRIRSDKGQWTLQMWLKKAGKLASFAGVALLVSMSATAYFTGPISLWTGTAGAAAYAGMLSLAGLLFVDFAWFREQFCNYLCPYARFQGALTDDHSLVIEYNGMVGEPRKKGRSREGAGACLDCGKCVTVCPQGVDIREGFQLECINCARCVDACTSVMSKRGQESLVRYTTIAQQRGEERRFFRPRTAAYGVLLSVILVTFVGLSLSRHSFEATVNRAPGTLFQIDDDGWTRNTFLLHVSNNAGTEPLEATVTLAGIDGAELIVPPITVKPAHHVNVPLVVRVPPGAELSRTMPLTVQITTDSDVRNVSTTFKSGATTGPLEG